MEEGVLPQSTVLGTSDVFMDLDMDELFLEGCWLEANGSEFSQFDTSIPFSPSFIWPSLENQNVESTSIQKLNPENKQNSSILENLSISQSQENNNITDSFIVTENNSLEQNRRWWIGPTASTSVMDRLTQAIGHIKDFSKDKDVLIQVWVPVHRGDKRVLVTNDQPVMLDLNCPQLAHYRDISLNYQFLVDEDSKEGVGLPGRVYRSKVPEWSPDVRFFNKDEYPRVGHAQDCDVRGTLAVPIFEQGSQNCLGVIEVVLTKQKIKYRPELESVCKALEAVDFTSSEVSNTDENIKKIDFSYKAALPEILNVLKSACETHGLPLAQTWVPCFLQGKGGCRHSDKNFKNCVSPVDFACYVNDPSIQGFHEACTEYHLLKDQGIVGKAFKTNQPCFSHDVTAFSQTEYPLSHHARMFGLKAAVALRLRSICTGKVDFVLEFFLPVKCVDSEGQRELLNSLSTIIQNVCETLTVVTDEELQEESVLLDNTIAVNLDQIESSRACSNQKNEENEKNVPFFQNEKSRAKLLGSPEFGLSTPDSSPGECITFTANPSTSGDDSLTNTINRGEKRRVKAEKTITLEVLRQHFAGSLKDAARNLGVCPTTLKRICRHHGIQRWPSRKIQKVGHSLQKIQRVINSVQGASGVLQIDSFYSNFPELASPNASKSTEFQFSKSIATYPTKPLDGLPKCSTLTPPIALSLSPSSSCSQTSSSSQCCSGKHPVYNTSIVGHGEVKEEFNEPMLKRARSDANLHYSSNEAKILQRSQSYLTLFECGDGIHNPPLAVEQQSGQISEESNAPRIKVTFGEDAIRFRMQNTWKYKDLLEEISRRFGVRDSSEFHLKYLDDDSEWVLLSCDEDLEECINVFRSSQSNTIKLSFGRVTIR